MAREYLTLTDGTFTFSETDNKNQFYFYRNDGKVLEDVGRQPMDMYHAYIMKKMMTGEITSTVINNVCFETSDDEKCIRLTISDFSDIPDMDEFVNCKNNQSDNSGGKEKQPNIFRRLIKKIFG